MTEIKWDQKARDFLRKLPKDISKRIFKKVDNEVRNNVDRYLERLVNIGGYKIRIGDYRLFVDYFKSRDLLIIRAMRHRSKAYKKKI
jgi:mRNA-degrading endonuclease RelE of RelBE toxin-antitoxin system